MVDQVFTLLHLQMIAGQMMMLCRKIFGTSHRDDLTAEVVSQMSVNAMAEQRKKLEDAIFD